MGATASTPSLAMMGAAVSPKIATMMGASVSTPPSPMSPQPKRRAAAGQVKLLPPCTL